MSEVSRIEDLKPDAENARRHDSRNIEMIASSLGEVGAARSIVIDEDDVILAGNGVLQAARAAGIENVKIVEADGQTIIAVRRSGLTAEQKKRLAYFDNRTAELADWNPDQVLADLDAGFDLSGLWQKNEIEELLAEVRAGDVLEDPGAQVDKAAELQEKWKVERGQVWEIPSKVATGKVHQMMCGDSTVAEDMEKLMDGELVKYGIHDPPYGIGIDTGWLSALNVKRGKPPNASDDRLSGDDGSLNVSCAFSFDKWLVWGFPYLANTKMTGWLVWDKWPGADSGLGNPVEMASTNLWDGFRLLRVMWGGYYKAAGESREPHPTQKPIGVIRPIIIDCTKPGDGIADYFLGSGTTLVACEQTGRIGYGMEIEPKYCAVTLERLASMGLEPHLTDT